MNKKQFPLVAGILGVLVIAFGLYYSTHSIETAQNQAAIEKAKKDALLKEQELNSQKVKMAGYTGNLIAGIVTPYLDFKKADYEKALSEGKIIVLNFYANWCPVCRAEAPDVKAGFDSLNNENVVGFRVNYNDPDTDESEKALAKEFGVTYQHTKVILKNGAYVFKETVQWSKEDLIDVVNKVAQ